MTSALGAQGVFDVAFIGRANIDLTLHVPHRASLGRTAFSTSLNATAGGKSLNQAITAARCGGRVCLIANSGADAWGEQLAIALADAGVDTSHFKPIRDASTGAAIIEVTPDGESYITLAVSTATELTTDDVHHALDAVRAPTIVVQLDLPPAPVQALLSRRGSALIVGNLIPHTDHDTNLLQSLDVLVVNQYEARAILRDTAPDALTAATELQRLGPRCVVVTAGSRGAAYTSPEGHGSVPAPVVPVIDTTGAGDAFLGCLAVSLTQGTSISDAVTAAVHVGSLAVQHGSAHDSSHDHDHLPGRNHRH